jgi:hypothetical protein
VQINTVARDELRHLDIDKNQKLLVAAFSSEIPAGDELIILDGHTLIEREADVSLVSAKAFAAMTISAMIFLGDEPASIAVRRQTAIAEPQVLITCTVDRIESARGPSEGGDGHSIHEAGTEMRGRRRKRMQCSSPRPFCPPSQPQ